MKDLRVIVAVAALAVAAFALAACEAGEDSTASPASTQPGATATQSPDSPVSATPGGAAEPGGSKLPALPPDRRAERAPIDALDIRVAESFPPQYFLYVLAGLPSGCAQEYGVEVDREGDVITVTVLNTMPADRNVACTLIYGTYEVNIALGSDFEPGVTYTVIVNDQEITFTAQ